MNVYPLIFGVREAITGNGFVGGITLNGRALMAHEEDGLWWVYGVEPGGLAASGETSTEAYLRFRETVRKVLLDSAALTAGFVAGQVAPDVFGSLFEQFRADVEMLGRQVDAAESDRWHAARAAIRAGVVTPEGPLAELPRYTSDEVKCSVEVLRLDNGAELKADSNSNPGFATAA